MPQIPWALERHNLDALPQVQLGIYWKEKVKQQGNTQCDTEHGMKAGLSGAKRCRLTAIPNHCKALRGAALNWNSS